MTAVCGTKKATIPKHKSKLARYLHTGGYRRLADKIDTIGRKNVFWRAKKVYIIDNSSDAIKIIKTNIKNLQAEEYVTVFQGSYDQIIKKLTNNKQTYKEKKHDGNKNGCIYSKQLDIQEMS